MSGTVSVAREDAVATVTLAHAGKFNAMSRSMWRSLRQVFEDFQAQGDLRCVVVQGQGAHFCAGGDIAEYPAFRFDVELLRDFHENEVWGGLQAMLDCDVPVIAQIDGTCMGAGLEIASCCDLRIASEAARFGAPIAKLGFPMAPREAALVLRSIGELTAREMLLSAAVLDAQTMQQRGFLNQVVGGPELAAAVAVYVHRMRPLAPQAARLNKRSFRALALVLSDNVASDLIASAYHYADSQEHREGVLAFTEKRPPQF